MTDPHELTPEKIAELKRLLAQGVQGPWTWDDEYGGIVSQEARTWVWEHGSYEQDLVEPDDHHELLIALRNLAPALIKAAEERTAPVMESEWQALKKRAEKTEWDLQKILGECITEARSAKDRADDQLEPPWDVVARLKRDSRALRRLEEKAREYQREGRESVEHQALAIWATGVLEKIAEARAAEEGK